MLLAAELRQIKTNHALFYAGLCCAESIFARVFAGLGHTLLVPAHLADVPLRKRKATNNDYREKNNHYEHEISGQGVLEYGRRGRPITVITGQPEPEPTEVSPDWAQILL